MDFPPPEGCFGTPLVMVDAGCIVSASGQLGYSSFTKEAVSGQVFFSWRRLVDGEVVTVVATTKPSGVEAKRRLGAGGGESSETWRRLQL